MTQAILPGSRVAVADGSGLPTIAWYSFFRDVVQKDVANIETSIDQLTAAARENSILTLYNDCDGGG